MLIAKKKFFIFEGIGILDVMGGCRDMEVESGTSSPKIPSMVGCVE